MGGFEIALHTLTHTPAIFAAMAGVMWGIVGGALPGLSASITMALLLPLTYGMDPVIAIILLASTYVGAEYGGSIPAILIRTPGTSGAVTTAIDGFEMHRQGKGGEALGISLACGVVGGLFGMLLLVFLMAPLAKMALMFTAQAHFAVGILGLTLISTLSAGSPLKGLMAGVFGLALTTIGLDPLSGVSRFTFGSVNLMAGIDPIFIMIGVFAITELFIQASQADWGKTTGTRIVLPGLKMWRRIWSGTMIGSGVGGVEGCIPGAGSTLSAFLAYNEARRWSKNPEEFGKGSPEAVAAPEAANNAVASTALIPTLAFGIPSSASMAVLLGGLILHGLEPGPLLIEKSRNVVYGLFGGLFVANTGQLLLGFLMLRPCVWLVNQPRGYLAAGICVLVLSGIYSIDQNAFDLAAVIGAGVLGYGLKYFGFPVLPLVLGVVLGGIIERNFRRSIDLGYGDPLVFFKDPIAGTLLSLILLVIVVRVVLMAIRYHRARRASAQAA